jgi:hypothetical protein
MIKKVKNVEVSAAKAELHRIRAVHGELRAPKIVDESRPDDAPLHPAFEWDDALAGEAYRVHQARSLVRAVMLEISEPGERTFMIPEWTHVPATESSEPVYVPTIELVDRPNQFLLAVGELARKVSELEHTILTLERLAKLHGNTAFEAKAPALTDAFAVVRNVLDGLQH